MKAYRCTRTGLLFPPDYMEQWGINGIGLGLGPRPVSEALINTLAGPSAKLTPDRAGKNAMFPVEVCGGPLEEVEVTDAQFLAGAAILAAEDPMMELRGRIMRSRQIAHGWVTFEKGDTNQDNIEAEKNSILSERK